MNGYCLIKYVLLSFIYIFPIISFASNFDQDSHEDDLYFYIKIGEKNINLPKIYMKNNAGYIVGLGRYSVEEIALSLDLSDFKKAQSQNVINCLGWHIACEQVVWLSIISTPLVLKGVRRAGAYWHGALTCCTTSGRSLLKKLPKFNGIEFFIPRYEFSSEIYFRTKNKHGEFLYGGCPRKYVFPNSNLNVSLKDFNEKITKSGRCHLRYLSVDNDVAANIAFDAQFLPNLMNLYESAVGFVRDLER